MTTNDKLTFTGFLKNYFGVWLLLPVWYGIASIVLLLPGNTSVKLARTFGVGEPLLKILGVLFGGVALALFEGLAARALQKLGAEVRHREVDAIFDALSGVMEAIDRHESIMQQSAGAPAKEGRLEEESALAVFQNFRSELDTICRELVTTKSEIKDAEARLRGEWRFVVGLIVAILLGVVPIVLGIVALLRAYP